MIIHELPYSDNAFAAFRKLAHLPYPVFLDSSLRHPNLGRVSYVAADPFHVEHDSADLHQIDQKMSSYQAETCAELPPFQGGLVNLCSYDLAYDLHPLESFGGVPVFNEFNNPKSFFGFYDTILIFEHEQEKSWIVSQGFPETEESRRQQRAEERAQFFRHTLESSDSHSGHQNPPQSVAASAIHRLRSTDISNRILSNFSKSEYIDAVQKCVDYIFAGDIFQVNLSQRLLCEQTEPSIDIYEKLRSRNQATFSAYLDLGRHQILSSSPERLLNIDAQGNVETRPIKGTRQRSCYPEANLLAAEGLATSEKDRSENVMIVDLLRNDLSKICQDDSIHVSTLCGIEQYEFVQHLVSVVRATLKHLPSIENIFKSIFPGGSITGAPKLRAMEIIDEVERVSRGPYCGSLGYFGFDGAVDQNILIRTITAGNGWLQIPVGGGIVSQSDPVSEYEETVHKAHGMLRAII